MSKMILEFRLPEEAGEAELARDGGEYYSVIVNYLDRIRSFIKHGTASQQKKNSAEYWRKVLVEILEEHEVLHKV